MEFTTTAFVKFLIFVFSNSKFPSTTIALVSGIPILFLVSTMLRLESLTLIALGICTKVSKLLLVVYSL